MKKKHLILLLCLSCFLSNISNLRAQIQEFKLSDYKLADYKRQGIDLSFNLSGVQSDYNSYSYNSLRNSFSNTFITNYFYYKNSRKYQGNIQANIQTDTYFSKSKIDTLKTKSSNYSYSTSFSINNRFYNPKEYFILLNFSEVIRIQSIRDKQDVSNDVNWSNYIDTKSTLINNQTSGSIGFGKGRIEPVEDARQAIYIFEELKKANKLKHEPSHDEIMEFAKRISEIKNKRVLDSRLKKIYELEQLDSILQSMDILNKEDIVYFSRLNDMWDFGGIQQRNSGFRIGLSYSPTYSFNKNNYKSFLDNTEDQFKSEYFVNRFAFSIDWSKPINQKLQSDLNLAFSYFSNDQSDSQHFFSEGIETSLNYSFGFYPNTRTSFYAGLSFTSRNAQETLKTGNVTVGGYHTDSYNISPFANITYYISPKFRINCYYTTRAFYNINEFNYGNDTHDISSNLAISLLYSFF